MAEHLAEMPNPNSTSDRRDLIFLSYAYEDEIFAKWLARKLAFFGYGVWIDQIKILGGESWVEEVEEAIVERSFRVLAILSESSISKPNPRKERTKALDVGKSLGISDFLITLNLDGTKPDWTTSDISYISFRESWANGLRRVLKKLDSLDTPRILVGRTELVGATLETGSELLEAKPEMLLSNWLPLVKLPDTLKVFDTSRLSMSELWSWPNYDLGRGRVAAFSLPAGDLGRRVLETQETHHWPLTDRIRLDNPQYVVTRILNRAIAQMLGAAGVQFCKDTKLYFIPEVFRGESIVRYIDTGGESRFIRTFGKRTFRKPIGPPEKVVHRPAARVSARRIAFNQYVVQVQPAVALFDVSGRPITGRAVGPRRKKVTLNWFNQDWRKRFLVFAQILKAQSLAQYPEAFEIGEPISFEVDQSLREDRLSVSIPGEEEDEKDVEIGFDEMEEWSE